MKSTIPFPVPLLPESTLIQESLLTAVQAHPLADAITLIEPYPPKIDAVYVDGEIENVQVGAAACVTVKVWPAIVSVPVRALVLVLAATD